jgi:hypothetical protein
MKKSFSSLFKKKMLRPIIYKFVFRLAAGVALSLLWNRFVNTSGFMSLTGDAFFVFGVLMFGSVWVNYLRLDGAGSFVINPFSRPVESLKRGILNKTHAQRSISDYLDEKPEPLDEPEERLEKKEEILCSLCASALSGIIFILISLF